MEGYLSFLTPRGVLKWITDKVDETRLIIKKGRVVLGKNNKLERSKSLPIRNRKIPVPNRSQAR